MAFVRAVAASDIAPGTIREVDVNGKTLAVANIAGSFHAIDNTCLHRGGPLGEGPVEGKIVTCPWHALEYNITTGQCLAFPKRRIRSYPVKVEDGLIKVVI